MIAAFALATALALVVTAADARAAPLALEVSPLPLHAEDDTVERIGALRYLGGLELRSSDRRFGGLSGLDISPDGRQALFVSDTGSWVQAALRYDGGGRLAGVGAAEIGRLLRPDGKPVGGKASADAESLARVGDGLAVAFERDHRIWLYRGAPNPFLDRPQPLPIPPDLRKAPANGGVEALAALGDGRLVLFAEDFPPSAPYTYGWIRERGGWQRFRYERTGLFRPTGAAPLPGGDLLILERRFTWIGGLASRLARVSPSALTGDGPVRSVELARLEPPLLVENFEGIDVRRDDAGRTLVYLVSDNNFNLLQKTVLLLFVLDAD